MNDEDIKSEVDKILSILHGKIFLMSLILS